MRISKPCFVILAALVAALPAVSPVHALDAAKVLKGDAASPNLFRIFQDFLKSGKKDDAVELLKYAADQGNEAAQWRLARLYERGDDGVAQDHLAAFKAYQNIAAQHQFVRPNTPEWQFVADALVKVGNYYKVGIPGTLVFADPVRAHMMFTTAAMIYRHPAAQFELGRKQIRNDHVFGQGRRGLRNLKLAFEKGHVGAEALIGSVLFEGELVGRNAVQGLVMLGRAKRRSSPQDIDWITEIHDEAYSLARPEDRAKALKELNSEPSPLE